MLFITGTFRSGSTLLLSILNVHPGILIAYQPFMHLFKMAVEKYYSDDAGNPSGKRNLPLGLFHFSSDQDRKKFSQELPFIIFGSHDTAELKQKMQKALTVPESFNNDMKPRKMVGLLDLVQPGPLIDLVSQFLLLFERAYSETKVPVLGFKELYFEELIDPFLNASSSSKVILLVRDPRAALASRNYGEYAKATGGKYPILFICRNWRRSVHQYAANRNKKNFSMVRYEDLIAKPEKCLKGLCRFLNQPFTPDMLNYSLLTDFSGNSWIGNSSFSTEKSINVNAINRWQNILSEDEVKVVDFFCGPEMEYMGYHRQYPVCTTKNLEYYEEERGQIKEWINDLGFTLTPAAIHEEKYRQNMLKSPKNTHTEAELYASFNGPAVFSQLAHHAVPARYTNPSS